MALKTYLLAPNFTFERDGPLRIGNIIADPFRPTKPLHMPAAPPPTVEHADHEYKFMRTDSVSVHGSVWAQFLQTARASLGGGASHVTTSEYKADTLDTVRIREDPSDEEAAALVQLPRVQAAVKAGLTGSAPVYMITGLKIAKGFRLNRNVAANLEGNAAAGIPVTAETGLGQGFDASRTKDTSEALRSGSDIVFAYQLHVIARKGWWHRRTEVDVYAPKSAFLHAGEREVKQEEMTAKPTTHTQLLEVAEENEDDSVKQLEALDGDEACVCIAFEET